MKYKVVATFVFENIEADTPEMAQELVDANAFDMYVIHPTLGKIDPSYEVEAVEHEMHQTGLTAVQEKEIEESIKAYQNGDVKESPRW